MAGSMKGGRGMGIRTGCRLLFERKGEEVGTYSSNFDQNVSEYPLIPPGGLYRCARLD